MKLLKLWLLLIVILPVTLTAQQNDTIVADTLETENGTILLYNNFTWSYLRDEPVMFSQEDDSTGLFTSGWINDQVFAYRLKPDSIRDTLITLTTGDRGFTMPVKGHKMWRGFTYSHKGLDIQLNKGDTIRAAFDGVVRYAKYNRGGFGYLLIIRHFNGLETYYAHNSKFLVKTNQFVRSGDAIALGGSTGRSRGPHLHFEIRYKDVPLDPLRVLDYSKESLLSDSFQISRKVFYPNDHPENAVVVKIKSGDTLGKLAKKYHTSVKEICAMNKIKPTTTLRIGRTIRVR